MPNDRCQTESSWRASSTSAEDAAWRVRGPGPGQEARLYAASSACQEGFRLSVEECVPSESELVSVAQASESAPKPAL